MAFQKRPQDTYSLQVDKTWDVFRAGHLKKLYLCSAVNIFYLKTPEKTGARLFLSKPLHAIY
jgi:hypothetical protein